MALPEAPQSRTEQYLAKIAGQTASLPEAPGSRVEQYLDYIAENETVSKEEITEQVSTWLSENIHEDPTVVIDKSLSVEGAAADAKAVGDEIADLKADLNKAESVMTEAKYGFEYGGIDRTNGELAENTIRARSVLMPIATNQVNKKLRFTCNVNLSTYLFKSIVFYNNGLFVKSLITTPDTDVWSYDIDGTFNSFRVSFGKTGNADFTQEEIDSFEIVVMYFISSVELSKKVNPYSGMKYVALGDSITYGFIPRNYEGYPGQLNSYAKLTAEALEMTFENYGINGSTMAYHSERNPMCMRYNDLPNDADVITVMGGTNDIRNGIVLGTMEDRDDSTFYGALHVIYGGLYKKYMIDQGVSVGKRKKNNCYNAH